MRPPHDADLRHSWIVLVLVFVPVACGEQAPLAPRGSGTSASPPPSASVLPAGLEPCGDVAEMDLLAGRDLAVGSVTVANNGDALYVTYATDGDWTLRTTHLEVAASLADIPTTSAGSPVVGKFSLRDTHDGATRVSYEIALADLGVEVGDDLVVAAHADLHDVSTGRSEGAWADGEPFADRGTWATHAGYEVQECVTLVEGTITAGGTHSCALSTAGDAYCWGDNRFGQLGDGTTTDRPVPTAVSMPPGVTFVGLDAGRFHTLAVSATGTAYAWGNNGFGQLGAGTTPLRSAPVAVAAPAGVDFADVSAGFDHSAALSTAGDAYGWGRNLGGQLGDGTTTQRLGPAAAAMPSGISFSQVSAGPAFTLALTAAGDGYAWGRNIRGELGIGSFSSSPVPVAMDMPSGVSFEEIRAGGGFTNPFGLALATTGEAYGWGDNGFGQLGDGTSFGRLSPTAVSMPTGVSFTEVAAAVTHSLAVSTDGRAYGWGGNVAGQLGDGTTSFRRLTPAVVAMPPGVSFTGIAGHFHSLAIAGTGGAYGWGPNDHGQVGDGTTLDRLTPTAVLVPSGVSFD